VAVKRSIHKTFCNQSKIPDDFDKDVVRRILAHHYLPGQDSDGPSWLAFLGHMKDSLWSMDLFNWDVERQGDLLGHSRTAPIGITLLHFDDRMNEIYARSFRTGLPTAIRGEEHPVLLLAQDFVKP
jgi:hypothetical protein